jgi:8-oxo-dGTP pyrophosphatase MutT (NUDIX family)
MQHSFIQAIKDQLREPLPGQVAQFRMAHVVRQQAAKPPPNARQAGVLALFYPHVSSWHLVFIERQPHFGHDRHAGQISFPGGKLEETDASLQETALRETEEEVGVPVDTIEILGKLTELYIPVSNFQVHPYVGFTDTRPAFVPDVEEVRSILEVPFGHLADPGTRRQTNLQLAANITLKGVPYFDVEGKILWGATAMMVSELLTVAEQAGQVPV